MRVPKYSFIGSVILTFLLQSALAQTTPTVKYPTWDWNVGDKWEIDTTLFSRHWAIRTSNPQKETNENEDHVIARYDVIVEVTGETMEDLIACWRLEFSPSEKAPTSVRGQKYLIYVSKEDGSIKKIEDLSAKRMSDPQLLEVEGKIVVLHAPVGFPLETIQWKTNASALTEKQRQSRSLMSVSRNKAMVDSKTIIEMEYRVRGEPENTVRQKWEPGKDWWTEYVKYNQGHKELEARLKRKINDDSDPPSKSDE